jgi:hypothetical protein
LSGKAFVRLDVVFALFALGLLGLNGFLLLMGPALGVAPGPLYARSKHCVFPNRGIAWLGDNRSYQSDVEAYLSIRKDYDISKVEKLF